MLVNFMTLMKTMRVKLFMRKFYSDFYEDCYNGSAK